MEASESFVTFRIEETLTDASVRAPAAGVSLSARAALLADAGRPLPLEEAVLRWLREHAGSAGASPRVPLSPGP